MGVDGDPAGRYLGQTPLRRAGEHLATRNICVLCVPQSLVCLRI